MSTFVMNVGSSRYENIDGCTKVVWGEFDSLQEAYAYAMGKSIELVINSKSYNNFYKQAFDLAVKEVEEKSLSKEEAEILYKDAIRTAIDKCRGDAFVELYEFATPVDTSVQIQSLIDVYGHDFLDILLELKYLIPVG